MRKRVLPALALVLAASPAAAKVVFTGYGNFQQSAHGRFKIEGPAQAQSALNLGEGYLEIRSFFVESVGLFATTSLREDTRLQVDFTWRDIGLNARTLRVQYAFLEHDSAWAQLRAGKLTLPIGRYNSERFYAFRRPAVSAPVFQGGILGMPIADIGVSASRVLELGPAALRLDVYAVNGYGPQSGSTAAFRNANAPGALGIINNVTPRDANHKIALGARVEAGLGSVDRNSLGASYYQGEWDPQGRNIFRLANGHAHISGAGFDLLAEYLHLETAGDQGMLSTIGQDWITDGFFATAQYGRLRVADKRLEPWVRYENYVSRGAGGTGGRERLWSGAGGLALHAMEGLAVKAEWLHLYYRLPFAAGDLVLKGQQTSLAMVVTF